MSDNQQTPRILLHNDETATLATRLRTVMPDVEIAECNSYEGLGQMIADFRPDAAYSVRFSGTPAFPTADILADGGPRWISVGGSGVDHLNEWDTDKVTVTNSAGVAAAAMAEYVFGTALHFTLDIAGLQRDQAAHHWQVGRMMLPLQGKTMLIVGLGHTGQAIARRAKAFGMRVLGTRARPAPMENVDEVHASDSVSDLWPQADIIAVSVPLLPSTHNLIDARAFAAMKPSALIVDVSRGGVINENALINALRNQVIAGAAMDVFETEPLPSDSPLWSLENLLISPHSSGVFADWANHSFEMFIENLTRWRRGEVLNNIVNPARGY